MMKYYKIYMYHICYILTCQVPFCNLHTFFCKLLFTLFKSRVKLPAKIKEIILWYKT